MKVLAKWLLIGLAVFGVLGAMVAEPTPKEQKLDRSAISACWEMVNDELQDLETRRDWRRACYEMERKYDERW